MDARAEQIAKEIADAADVFLAGMEDGPVDTDERRDALKRYAKARQRILAIDPLETAIIARAYLRELAERREGGWQPIETAPRDGTHILLAWGGQTILGWWLDNSRERYLPWAGWTMPSMQVRPKGKPTHWLHLPIPPTGKDQP